ncbi:hypothetical protein AAG570_008232 [Ranatra chinensis]|uniref:Uncharacterized protein n=1 Tax=Ranatra chinensis TaxID=642074 RepID=A0ABD0XV74_9HEMI
METLEDVVAAALSAVHTVATFDSVKTEYHDYGGVQVPITGSPRATSSSEQCSGIGTRSEPIQHIHEEGVIGSTGGSGNHLPNARPRYGGEIEGALRGGQKACGEDGPSQCGMKVAPQQFAYRLDAVLRALKEKAVVEWGTTYLHPSSRPMKSRDIFVLIAKMRRQLSIINQQSLETAFIVVDDDENDMQAAREERKWTTVERRRPSRNHRHNRRHNNESHKDHRCEDQHQGNQQRREGNRRDLKYSISYAGPAAVGPERNPNIHE